MLALQGVGVLVTRPVQQALSLCCLLEAAGATTLRFPAIDIRPEGDSAEWRARLGPLDAFEIIVFTSANAVRFGTALLAPLRPQQSGPQLAAIGPATAQALEQSGYRVTVAAGGGFDSENLLLQPAFAQLAGRRVLIVKGAGGRELLQHELSRRGAHVVLAEVYRREPTPHSAAALATLAAHFSAGGIQVITATSAEIAAGLVAVATPALRREFDRAHWVVPGARVAAALRGHGVTAPVLQADTARDQDLVAAIVRWRASVSGA